MPVKNGIVYDLDAFDLDEEDGVFLFDNIVGQLQPRLPQIEVTVRPGLPGEALRTTGVRALPTQLITIHYVADHAAALAAIAAYGALLDGRICKLFQNFTDWGHLRLQAIQPGPLEPIASAAGTLVANPTVLQRISWTVIATPAPAP